MQTYHRFLCQVHIDIHLRHTQGRQVVMMDLIWSLFVLLFLRCECYIVDEDYSLLPDEDNPLPPDPASRETDRIVGGRETTIEEYPHQVSFIVDKRFCGGFIVSDRYILTAAHCVDNANPSNILLRAGSGYRDRGTIIPIEAVTRHPEYGLPRKFDKDVAVLKTKQPITFSDTVQPIALPQPGSDLLGGSSVSISGWGRMKQTAERIPLRLRGLQIPVVHPRWCRKIYSTYYTTNQFCAGNLYLGGQSTCQGDSGGAAVAAGVAVGVVSYGRGCGKPKAPSVFADLTARPIRDFIRNNTGL